MKAALKALTYSEPDLKKNYKLYRAVNNVVVTPVKGIYKMNDYKIRLRGGRNPCAYIHPQRTHVG